MGHFTAWISPFAQRNHDVYSQASRSKFILIIVGIYMYTKEERNGTDEYACRRLTTKVSKKCRG